MKRRFSQLEAAAVPGRIAESLNEHRALMAAFLTARDAATTVSAVQAHFRSGLEAAA